MARAVDNKNANYFAMWLFQLPGQILQLEVHTERQPEHVRGALLHVFAIGTLSKEHIVMQVHIYEHSSEVLDKSISSRLEYPHYIWHGAVQELPLRWFECNAVQHQRIIVLHVVSGRDGTATAIWCGNTWSYRGALIHAGVQGTDH